MTIGIRAIGHCLGEKVLDAEGFAREFGFPEAAVRKSLGDGRVYISSAGYVALAVGAAQACLERAGRKPEDVDAVVVFSFTTSGEHGPWVASYVQAALGATQAFTIAVGHDCSDSLTAMAMAQDLIRAGRARSVLIAAGVSWADVLSCERRVIGAITETNHRDIFSDGGAAALIEELPPGEGIEFLGFGFATSGQHASHIRNLVLGENVLTEDSQADELRVGYDSLPLHRRARDRCLRDAGLQPSQVDCMLFPQEASGLPKWFAKHLGFTADRLICYSDVSHVGAPDVLLGLERLQGSARRGLTVLAVARTVGIMRCAALRF